MTGEEFSMKNVVSLAVQDAKRYREIENQLMKVCMDSLENGLHTVPISLIAHIYDWSKEIK